MPTYQIEMNGQTFQIDAPDDASVNLAVKQLQSQGGAPAGLTGNTDTGMARLIKGEPQSQDGSLSADNASRSFATGVPIIGGLLNKMDAATNAALAPIVDPMLPDSFQKLPGETFADRYKQAMDIQQGKDASFHEKHPYVDTGLNIAGGVAGTVPAMMAAPAAFGVGSGPILGRSVVAGVTGAGIGGTDAAIRSDLDAKQTALGSGIGLVAGAAGPAIGKAVGAGVRYFTQPSDAISDLSGAARNYVTQELSDPAKIAAQQAQLARLGPDATLADVSPEWLGVARGAATRPGTRDAIVEPLMARQAQANARLAGDLDSSLGSAVVPSQVDQTLQASQQQVMPLYREAFANAQPFNTQPIAQALTQDASQLRGPAQAAVSRVRGMLNVNGSDQLSTDPRVMFETRQAIDGMLTGETDPKVLRALSEARQMIDDGLTQAVPGIKDADAAYAELARQREALQQGRPILNNQATALRPQEVQDMLQQGALPQGQQIGPSGVPTRMQQSVRAEIDRAAGTNAIDTTALRNIVRGEGDWNRQKLGMLFGEDNANNALNAIDRETVFGDTANRVTRGSDTAMAGRFGDFLDATGKPKEIPGDLTAIGVVARTGKKIINAMLESNAGEKAARFANELGELSVATGTPRDQLVQALISRAQQSGSTANPAVQNLINAVVQGAGRQTLR
ncbi:hypothetical protein [Rhizobium sp. AP16]|uniref:hypothetical protein n=1 Tax=Rhizobium sp. AP16 TaxID=1144306 RepID=UPI00026ED246|nr:hypothetical protein [Rhizobium sp. AP16]EJK83531.1 hypothetical protein PMI03_03186 [Rhizobium sp. AP16]